MNDIIAVLQYTFFQKALFLSVLAALPCAIIGTYIVVKRISMISGSISHAAFGGLGIGYFFGFDPLIGATVFGIMSGSGIGILQRKAKNRFDSLLSFIWAFGMAIGLLFINLGSGYGRNLNTYLFGNILLIPENELIALAWINLIIIIAVIFMFQTFKQVLFDEEFAEVRNIPILLVNIIFYILIALTIIVMLSLVGVVLLIAYLTLPPATALFFQKSIKRTMILSGIIMAISNTGGLFIAHLIGVYFTSVPPGPVIVLLLSIIYLSALLGKTISGKTKSKRQHIHAHSCDVEIESFGSFRKYLQTKGTGDHETDTTDIADPVDLSYGGLNG